MNLRENRRFGVLNRRFFEVKEGCYNQPFRDYN